MLFTCCYSDMVNGKLHAPHNCRSCVADSSNTSIPAQPAYSSYLQRSQVLRQVPLSLATHGRMTHFRHENWEKHADIYESYMHMCVCVRIQNIYKINAKYDWLKTWKRRDWMKSNDKLWNVWHCVCVRTKKVLSTSKDSKTCCATFLYVEEAAAVV